MLSAGAAFVGCVRGGSGRAVAACDDGVDLAGAYLGEVQVEQFAAGDLAAVQGLELDVGGLLGEVVRHAETRSRWGARAGWRGRWRATSRRASMSSMGPVVWRSESANSVSWSGSGRAPAALAAIPARI